MTPKELSGLVSIIFFGVLAGLVVGVGISQGVHPDEAGLNSIILEESCNVFSPMDASSDVEGYCETFVPMMLVLSVLLMIVSAIDATLLLDDWVAGVIIYGISFVAAILMTVLII